MIHVFTDGACHPNPSAHGGWSFVAYEGNAEIHAVSGQAEGHTTSNRMEMTAVLRAMMWLGDRPAVIHSDSQYVVNGLNSWCRAWQRRGWKRKDKDTKKLQPVMNADLWQVMLVARSPGHQLKWVRGHNGTVGNERADQLACAARRNAAAQSPVLLGEDARIAAAERKRANDAGRMMNLEKLSPNEIAALLRRPAT